MTLFVLNFLSFRWFYAISVSGYKYLSVDVSIYQINGWMFNFFYYNDWIHQEYYTNLYNSHDCARLQFNLYAKWKKGAKINIIACCFLVQKKKREKDENNTRKVDNWFSILCFLLSLSLYVCVYVAYAMLVCPRLRGCCLPPSPLCSWT